MAGLKADLDNYLSGSKGSSTLSNLTKSFTLPNIKSPFSNKDSSRSGGDDEEALLSDSGESNGSGWYTKAKTNCLPSLSKKQRVFGFVTSLGLGLFFFSFATLYVPVIVLKARKFALLFSLGSLFTLGSFSFLWGPCNHVKHLFGKERLPFTLVYLGSLVGTLYFALSLQSTILTSMAAVCQVMALIWFVVSYIPGGQTGMKFFGRICSSMCKKGSGSVLPI
jgi:hypothetical protein